MNTKTYPMRPADPQKDVLPISQVVAEAFAGGQYVEELSQQYIANCHYDFDTTRLIWDAEQLIHHWGVWGYPMRLDGMQLKVAGIGAVTTREPYRKQGLMARAALDSFRAMLANGYDLSILRGRHYVKFGYARAWNYIKTHLTPEEIPDLELQVDHIPLGPEHMDALIARYNQDHSKFSGTVVRPTYRMLKTGDMGAYGWFADDGALAGYVRAVPTEDKKCLQCLEAAGDAEQGLAILGTMVKTEGYEKLTFFTLPEQHPILQRIRRGACVVENQYFLNTGWRVKIINLISTLEKLRPRLEARLQRSYLASWKGDLLLDSGRLTAGLNMDQGKIQVMETASDQHAIHGGVALGRLLIGSDHPDEIIHQEEMRCSGDALELARVLFPNLYPVMSHFDEY